ncbi:LysR family transcriptional regulator [Paraburkholderia solisilvae]|uniref:HTH-type transcriptional regulator DmlR n=1 Tax=Paraburkholderia solisilvae TaxID=624376 RepID=A0A6J5CYQ1_9BURK|nr:LysR family transcriptional regulator [Paraburkholderia solisilvae]CAB3746102.1 HTH-type transcriptional regulator DmlR [Paraburkholderia solisilvae]
MDTLRNMKMFVEVAEAGSFTAAAQQLDTTTGYVSRSVSELEAHLRTRLLNRTTRRIALTEAGERYLVRCLSILESVTEAELEASEAHARPAGTLRVHAMSSIGQNYVVPAVAAFQERFPAVTVDLTLSQNVPDLLEDGYDVALRTSPRPLPDSNYISHHLGIVHSVLCASPAYLEVHGRPETAADLSHHMCLQVSVPIFPADRWTLIGKDGQHEFLLPTTRFKVNLADAMAAALIEGMGIGALPALTVRSAFRNGTLVRVLPDYYLQDLNIYLVYASRQYLDAKIKAWVEFLKEWIGDALREDDTLVRMTAGAGASDAV